MVNSKIMKKSKRTKLTIDNEFAYLTIKKIDIVDAGKYKVSLTNSSGETSAETTLIVLGMLKRHFTQRVLGIVTGQCTVDTQ